MICIFKKFRLSSCAFCALLMLLLAFGSSGIALAQKPTTSLSWTTEAWTDDNRPYAETRMRVRDELASSRDPARIVASYRQSARRQPRNALAVYCWAAAAWEASVNPGSEQFYRQVTTGVREALAVPLSPHTYDYARMRYLFEADANRRMREMKELGDRLLAVDQRDPPVLYQTALAYTDDVPKAAALLDEAIALAPTSAANHGTLGYIYVMAFLYRNGPEDYARKGITELRIYLSLSPKNEDSCNWARIGIDAANRKLSHRARR
ncbi:MAG: hypothetical protein P4L33_05945 [Capsulimonadaceae bacterium]|nr:hypothetical protein [Capsulimonadaceae bacterium]